MAQDGKQYIVIRVGNVVDEADFFSRVFDGPAMVTSDTIRQVDTGAFVLRIEYEEDEAKRSHGVHFEITVDNVNKFTEEVWNRGLKYASRPQNYDDGLRRVGFVSPGNVRVFGAGPLKMDSTGVLPVFRPRRED